MTAHVLTPRVALRRTLRRLRALAACADRPLPGKAMPPLDGVEVRARLRGGRPALHRATLEIDLPPLRRRFQELVQTLEDCGAPRNPRAQEALDAVLHRVACGRAWRAAARHVDSRLEPEAAAFLAFCALKPAFRAAAGHVQRLAALSAWRRATCPVCGSLPAIAELRGAEGRRVLRCLLCDTAWEFFRLRCPFCGESRPERLGYFMAEGEGDRCRVDRCETCRGYLKTVLARIAPMRRRPLSVDLATLHLDVLARQRGLRRLTPSPFGWEVARRTPPEAGSPRPAPWGARRPNPAPSDLPIPRRCPMVPPGDNEEEARRRTTVARGRARRSVSGQNGWRCPFPS